MIGADKDLDKRWQELKVKDAAFYNACSTCRYCVFKNERKKYKRRTFYQFITGAAREIDMAAVWFASCVNNLPVFEKVGSPFAYFKYSLACKGDFWEKKDENDG